MKLNELIKALIAIQSLSDSRAPEEILFIEDSSSGNTYRLSGIKMEMTPGYVQEVILTAEPIGTDGSPYVQEAE